MSDKPRSSSARDEGFTLVEVVVALGVLMVVMAAVLPQVVVGLRGATVADSMTAAKGVIEAQMEKMRNLPWHVAPSAELRIDVLDRYYPDLTPPTNTSFACLQADGSVRPPSTTRSGYVSTTTRCSYEPASGPFYRMVEVVDPAGPAVYTLVTDTQFLTSEAPTTTPAVYGPSPAAAPSTGYDSTGVTASDNPISEEVGVTVTAFDTRPGKQLKPLTAYTQIANDLRAPERITAVADTTAIQVSGVTRDDKSVSASAGQLDLAGFLARLSTASAQLTAVAARWSADDPQGLAKGPVSAPPATTAAAVTGTAGSLNGTCDFVCWSVPSTSAIATTAASGQPVVASSATPGTPVQSAVTGSGTTPSLTFSNTTVADRPTYYRKLATDLALDPDQPIVSVGPASASISSCGSGGGGSMVGRGFVTSTATTVTSCVESATSTVSLFPRRLLADPVLRLTLEYSNLRCSVTPTANTRSATASFRLKVEVAGRNGTVTKTLTETSPDSDLQGLLTTQISASRTLADYVKSWSLGTRSMSTSLRTTASASVPGVLSLVTNPVRNLEPYTTDTATYTPDPASSVSLTLGAASCLTKDAR